MDIISSIFSIAKNVSETDREFRILRDKLVFHIKKAETALSVFKKDHHVLTFIGQNLEGRLHDAKERLIELEGLLSSSSNQDRQSISFKDKIKLSLPFNNEKDKISQAIEDLRQATEEVLNNQLSQKQNNKHKVEGPPPEVNVDEQIDQIYEMGPTIQENNALDALEFAKIHTVELKIEALGQEEILNQLLPDNKMIVVEKTEERVSKVEIIQLFQMGRMNFKKEYKSLAAVFPDIGKISRFGHFKIFWKRAILNNVEGVTKVNQNVSTADLSLMKSEVKGEGMSQPSQKKEEGEQFFSVPDQVPEQMSNGKLILQKEKSVLYRRGGVKWEKLEDEEFQLMNGEEVAISLNKESEADLFFKLTYRFK